MAEIMGVSQTAPQRREPPLSWLQRLFRALQRPRQEGRSRRLDERTWSAYMLRDVGLDGGGLSRGRDPRDLFDWPLR